MTQPATDNRFFGHPRGLATLFFTEFGERFSYYGMRALLILFMTAPAANGGLGFGVPKATAIYGLYTAMVYLLSLPGGWIADRVTGQRRAVLYGGILIAAGEFCLMAHSLSVFYTGLVLLVFGTGMLKPNVSTIVGQIYAPGDVRRDAGFSIFYMGINLGALIAPLITGYVGEKIDWRLGFGIAGLGMVVGIVQYVLTWKYLGEAGLYPTKPASAEADRAQKRRAAMFAVAGIVVVAIIAALSSAGVVNVNPQIISDGLGFGLVALSVAVFAWLLLGRGSTAEEKKRYGAILVLYIASITFFAVYEQAGSSLNLFAERNTDRNLFGFVFPASWYQFVEPAFVILLAPVLAWLWIRLGRRDPSAPSKFAMGLAFVAGGFAIMLPAAALASSGRLAGWYWLVLLYLMHAIGELLLSPVGLSAMTKLAPQRLAGLMMGVWFVSLGIGNYLAGRIASFYGSIPLTTIFGLSAGVVFVAAAIMFLLVRPTVRLMSGVK